MGKKPRPVRPWGKGNPIPEKKDEKPPLMPTPKPNEDPWKGGHKY